MTALLFHITSDPTTISAPKARVWPLKAPGWCPSLTTELKSQTSFRCGSYGKFSFVEMALPSSFVINPVPANVQKINSLHFPSQGELLRRKGGSTGTTLRSQPAVKCQEPARKAVSWHVSWHQSSQHAHKMRASSCAHDYVPFRNRMKKTDIYKRELLSVWKRTKVRRLQLSHLQWNRHITEEVAKRFVLFDIYLIVKFSLSKSRKQDVLGFGVPYRVTNSTLHLWASALWVALEVCRLPRWGIPLDFGLTLVWTLERVHGMLWKISHVLAGPLGRDVSPPSPECVSGCADSSHPPVSHHFGWWVRHRRRSCRCWGLCRHCAGIHEPPRIAHYNRSVNVLLKQGWKGAVMLCTV